MKSRFSPVMLWLCWLAQLSLVTAFDYYSGYEVKLGALYALPVAFAAWYLGRGWGWAAAFAAAGLALWAEKAAGKVYSSEWIAVANTASRLAIFVFVHLSVTYFRRTIDLAQRQMKAFEGKIHVCCACHRVDGGDEFWTDFPTFLRNNTQAQVEFKSCPSCVNVPSQPSKSSS